MEKSDKVTLFSFFILVGFVFSVFFHYLLNIYFNLPNNLLGNFVWPTNANFFQFSNSFYIIKTFTFSQSNLPLEYFPLAYFFIAPFCFLKTQLSSLFLFLFFCLTGFLFFNTFFLQCKNLSKLENFQNIFVFSFFSYPLLMTLDFGNINLLLVLFFSCFISLFYYKKFVMSNIFLILTCLINPCFIFFSLLFLFKKKYKNLCYFLLVFCFLFFLCLYLLNIPFATFFSTLITSFNNGSFNLLKSYSIKVNYYSFFLCLYLIFNKLLLRISLYDFVFIYNYFILFFITLLLFFSWREKVFWKQVFIILFAISLFPYYISDFELLFVFVPIWLFINEEKRKSDLFYTISFSFLLLPKAFGLYLNPFLLLIIIGKIIVEQFNLLAGENND